jgi:hypothetical protein
MSRRSYFVTVRACGITETNGKMDLHNGMGFELELANADTVAWSSEVSILKEKARNKKSSKKKARECKDKSSQRLDCTWPRFGSASQVCFENSPVLRILVTSILKSEEEEEKESLPAYPSWVVSACTICVNPSMPGGGIQTTTILSLRVSSIQNLAYIIRKRYVVSCVVSTRQICFPTGAGELPVI